MTRRLSLSSRLALLFAACTAVVSLLAGVLFNHASQAHFIELDQQLLDSRVEGLRATLAGLSEQDDLLNRLPALEAELAHQNDLNLRVQTFDQQVWFDSAPTLPASKPSVQLQTLNTEHQAFRTYSVPLDPSQPQGLQLTLLLDITHHQHFLQRMQQLIWLTVGLSALATALLGAWAARSGLRPLRLMSEVASGVSARSLTTRLPANNMPAELDDLAASFNAMLERLDDAFQRLSAFSADIAHELRTPLSNLLTHTQVTLTRPRALEDYREALHSNLEELQWMAQLVNDMLYLAKADHGLLLPDREPLQLETEVDALLDYFTPVAEDANVLLSRDGQGNVTGDRAMLRRALSNLLDNALRFTPGGGEVCVEIEAYAEGVRIEVQNSGAGIAPEIAPRLFDRFYRADPARREGSSEHAGLGLALTRSIVQAHGGQIRCESSGGWTRFIVDLPSTPGAV